VTTREHLICAPEPSAWRALQPQYAVPRGGKLFGCKLLKIIVTEVLKDVLEDADGEVRAPYGPAAALVGYSSTGSSLDWAADRAHVAWPFTVEIYGGFGQAARHAAYEEERKERSAERLAGKRANRQGQLALLADFKGTGLLDDLEGTEGSGEIASEHSPQTSFLHSEEAAARAAGVFGSQHCMVQFNPLSRAGYDAVTQEWAAAYAALLRSVGRRSERATGALRPSTHAKHE